MSERDLIHAASPEPHGLTICGLNKGELTKRPRATSELCDEVTCDFCRARMVPYIEDYLAVSPLQEPMVLTGADAIAYMERQSKKGTK